MWDIGTLDAREVSELGAQQYVSERIHHRLASRTTLRWSIRPGRKTYVPVVVMKGFQNAPLRRS
jgi:hypothetical protein